MTTEREELRLTVSLVDNVSAGLNKIKGEFKDLNEGSGKGQAEKFKKASGESIAILKRMAGEAGEAYKAFGMMRLGALGAAGGVALLGFEISKQIKEWGEYAEKVRSANQTARAFGVDPGVMRNIVEQLKVAGVSAEQSTSAITRFADKMGELQRDPSATARIMQQAMPGRGEALRDVLRQLDAAKDLNERLEIARQAGINIEQNALKRGETPERAAGERNRFDEMIGYNRQALGVAGQLKSMTEEQAKAEKDRNTNLEAYGLILGQIEHNWDEITKLLKDPIFGPDSTLVKGAKALRDTLGGALQLLEFVKGGGLDVIFHPTDPEARKRSLEAFKKMQHEHEESLTPEERAKEHETEETAKRREEQFQRFRGTDPRKFKPISYEGGGGDYRGLVHNAAFTGDDDRGDVLDENTKELKTLNDLLREGLGLGGAGGGGFQNTSYGGAGGAGGGPIIRPGGRFGGLSTGPGSSSSSSSSSSSTSSNGPASLTDEKGNAIDQETMKTAETLGKAGDVGGLQKLFAARGYHMSGPACGIVASKYAAAAGFKAPPGGAVASNWHKFGEQMKPEDINSPDHPFGSMFGTYYHRRYGGNVGAPLATGDTGGHVMTIVPGTYDAKTGKVDVVDQYGYSHGKRNISDMDLRFAGADAVRQLKERRGQAGDAGTAPPSGAGNEQRNIRNFMKGLSYLETSNDPRQAAQTESGNTGFFRQNATDAAQARGAGLPDPRTGTYEEQSKANWNYIQKFMPKAAAQIKAGNLEQAGRMLSGHWVGLPGGSQPQNAARMAQWHRILQEGRDKAEAAPASAGGGASPVSQEQIERARQLINKNSSTKVEGSGKLSVHVRAPKGTSVGAEGKGLFKDVEINRQTQMEPAKKGPSKDDDEVIHI